MRSARIAAGGVCAVAAVLLGLYLLIPREYYTGTNSVRTRAFLIELTKTTGPACFGGLTIPAGTGQMVFETQADAPSTLDFEITFADGERHRASAPVELQRKVNFVFPETASDQRARACVETSGDTIVRLGGVPGVRPGEEAPTIGGEPTANRAAIWYRPPPGEEASVLSQLPTLFERMAVFRPSWVGPWTYWVLFLAVVPLLVLAGLRLVLNPDRRRLALLVGLLGFANAAVWAHVTPTFNSPDESEHFAYLQSLAERGEPPETGATVRPPYSGQQTLLIDMTRVLDSNETADGKPPWEASEEAIYRDLVADRDPAADDGGGATPSTATHAPAYYALGVPAYLLAGDDTLNQLTAARLTSALLGGLIAACAVLLVLELAPQRRGLAAAAGVAVAFQPMFAFMSGSVNNDMGVNAVAAVVTVLLVRLVRRGFGWPLVVALGLLLGLAPLMKGTGYALFPPALVALVLAAWRFRGQWRRVLGGVAVVAIGILAVSLAWAELSAEVGRESFTTPDGGAPVAGTGAAQQPFGALSYVWQVFLPQLPFMHEHWVQSWPAYDIYGVRAWGAFGWYAVTWPGDVYWTIMITLLAVTALGLFTLARRRDWLRERWPELLVLVAIVATVIGVMIAAYYTPDPVVSFPQQGRYIFPAITALAAMFVGATVGAGRALAVPLRVGLTTAVVCLGYASLWLVLTRFYFAA